jgi:FkbM family methyltransferase
MGTTAATYRPTLKNVSKYSIYSKYFFHYFRHMDFKSLWVSISYVLFNKLPNQDYQTKSEMGNFLIRKRTTDFQFINYAYEHAVKKYMMDHLDSFDVFIDAGACIGEYCIWLAGLGKKCYAFEPVNYQAIVNNIALNRGAGANIKAYHLGLSNKKGSAYFNIPDKVLSSSHIVFDDTEHEPNVQLDTLDNLYQEFNFKPTDRILMKLDVEGMEPEVIQGAKEFIRNTKNISIIYEHFELDNGRNDKAIAEVGNFTFGSVDDVNRIATKQS